jgi:hypothetical protein
MDILLGWAAVGLLGIGMATVSARLGWERLWFMSWCLMTGVSVLLLAVATLIAVGLLFTVGSLPIETVVALVVSNAVVIWLWKPALRLYRKQEMFFVLRHLSRQQ